MAVSRSWGANCRLPSGRWEGSPCGRPFAVHWADISTLSSRGFPLTVTNSSIRLRVARFTVPFIWSSISWRALKTVTVDLVDRLLSPASARSLCQTTLFRTSLLASRYFWSTASWCWIPSVVISSQGTRGTFAPRTSIVGVTWATTAEILGPLDSCSKLPKIISNINNLFLRE